MAAVGLRSCEQSDTFFNAVKFVLGNWPAVRLAVEQGFGGKYNNDKERWLEEVVFSLFQENEGIDSLDVEDFLAEILNNEFDVIVEDGSLPKVAQKLCNYYKLCKNGEHSSVTEEIMSVKLPKLNVKYGDCNGDNEMELSEHGEVAEQLEDLNIGEEACSSTETYCEDNRADVNGNSDMNHEGETEEEEGWMVVRRSKRKH